MMRTLVLYSTLQYSTLQENIGSKAQKCSEKIGVFALHFFSFSKNVFSLHMSI